LKEYIFDLRTLDTDDIDNPARVEAEKMLLDHAGIVIRVRVTQIKYYGGKIRQILNNPEE